MPTERRASLMDNQRTELQPTHDAMLAWKSACALYQILPGLRGFWPMSGQDTATTDPTGIVWLLNQSGNSGAILQYIRGTGEELGYSGIIPYAAVYGAGEPYLLGTIASEYRITGTETYIAAAQRGLTIGAWWKFTATSAAEGLMGRDDGSGLTWSYYLEKQATDYPRFVITNNGSSAYGVTTTNEIDASSWHLIIGRFTTSTSNLAIFLNGVKDTTTVGGLSSIYDSEAPFRIGYDTRTAGSGVEKWVSLAFICGMALSDTLCSAIWHHTRAMFGR